MRVGWASSWGAHLSQSLSMAYEPITPRTAAVRTAWRGKPSAAFAVAKGAPIAIRVRRIAKA